MAKTLFYVVGCAFVVSCSGATAGSGSSNQSTPDAGLGCCPSNFDLYSCQHKDGTTGMACHNPAMGCASSLTCGQGCDPEVSGSCQCVQNVLCVIGSHFDHNLCKCIPDATTDAGTTCVQNVLCVVGDHFDRTLCKCVPDSGASSCVTAADCKGVLPALCQQCSDGTTACAHFACASGSCQVVTCG